MVCESAQLLASCHFSLHIIEGLFVDDGFVGVLHIELRQLATVLFSLFGERVFNIFLLQEQVSGVGYIAENHFNVGVHPAASVSGGDALGGKFSLGLKAGLAIKEVLEDAAHNGCFLRDNDQLVAFPAVAVHSKVAVRDALLHALSGSPFYIVAQADTQTGRQIAPSPCREIR